MITWSQSDTESTMSKKDCIFIESIVVFLDNKTKRYSAKLIRKVDPMLF